MITLTPSLPSNFTRELSYRLLNVGLRSLSLGSRFVILFALARLLPPTELGLYGLMTATIGFSVLVIGGDYYTYSQRELLSRPKEQWSFVIQHQCIATIILYIFLLPLQGLIFIFDLLPKQYAIYFFAILVSEHFSQELNRLLIAMKRPLTASWVLFVRLGLWVWVVLPLMWFVPSMQNLKTIFFAWFIGSALAGIIGIIIVWHDVGCWRWWNLDWKWLRLGYKKGLMFLVATMCFRALFTVDRYIIEHFSGGDMLGVYVLYMSMAAAIINFMDPAIFSFIYPRLVSAWRQGQHEIYKRTFREFALSSILTSLGLALICATLAPWVLNWTGKSIYLNQLPLLWVLLSMAVIYAMGMVPHYGLYAIGADRSIMFAHISSLAVFVISVVLMLKALPLYVVPLSLVVAFSWMGGLKMWLYLVLKH